MHLLSKWSFISSLAFFSIHVSVGAATNDLPTDFVPAAKNEAGRLQFSPKDMVVMPLKELLESQIDLPALEEALKAYHLLQPFKQSRQNFYKFPNKYFNDRLESLNKIMEEIPAKHDSPILKKLSSQIANKALYIKTLPNMLDPRCSVPLNPQSPIAKNLPVRDSYWVELLDPLRRAGAEIALLKQFWKISEIPNFFIYLETIEGLPLFQKYAAQDHQVQYYATESERALHRLSFKNGLAYYNGKEFDTREFETTHLGTGRVIFVLGPDNEFYVNNYLRYYMHHSSEFAGQQVLSAGEFMARNGKIYQITNKSGHYSPTVESLLTAMQVLQEKLGSINGMCAYAILAKGAKVLPVRAEYDAAEFLRMKGDLLCKRAQFRWSPLHIAVWQNQLTLSKQALSENDINALNEPGLTPLHLAVQGGHLEWIDLLLNAGAEASIATNEGYTPLHHAAEQGDVAVIERLLPYSDLSSRAKDGETPLLLAIKSGNIAAFEYLFRSSAFRCQDGVRLLSFSQGVTIDTSNSASECRVTCDFNGNGALSYAIVSKNAEMLDLQLTLGGTQDLMQLNFQGASLLHIASGFGTAEAYSTLIEQGLDPLQTDNDGENVFHWAAKHNNSAMMEYLLKGEHIWMLSAKNYQGVTPLHHAAAKLAADSFEKLIPFVKNVDIEDDRGETALFYAIKAGKIRTLLLLLKHGADIHHFNHAGQAPIHASAASPLLSINALLCHADDIDLQDFSGNIPLQIALGADNIYIAQYLIPHTPSKLLMHKNHAGLNAWDMVVHLDDSTTYDMIMKKYHE